jgi:hypothetical protein
MENDKTISPLDDIKRENESVSDHELYTVDDDENNENNYWTDSDHELYTADDESNENDCWAESDYEMYTDEERKENDHLTESTDELCYQLCPHGEENTSEEEFIAEMEDDWRASERWLQFSQEQLAEMYIGELEAEYRMEVMGPNEE